MPIRISRDEARSNLDWAIELAQSGAELPETWTSFAEWVYSLPAITYAPALGAVLLARATRDDIDPLSIKETEASDSYSMRSVCHEVLVPAARMYGFSIRATGPEPLNNQPFLRYLHMSEIDRVRNPANLRRYVQQVSTLSGTSRPEALLALAAFLRVGFEQALRRTSIRLAHGAVPLNELETAVQRFLGRSVGERPKRLQAFAAACLDLNHPTVESRRINDPSMKVPGDVQVWIDGKVIISVEVRGKPVSSTDLESFVDRCANAEIAIAILFVDWVHHTPIDLSALDADALRSGRVLALAIESASALLWQALAWAYRPVHDSSALLASRMLERLIEIEASEHTLREWKELIDRARP